MWEFDESEGLTTEQREASKNSIYILREREREGGNNNNGECVRQTERTKRELFTSTGAILPM